MSIIKEEVLAGVKVGELTKFLALAGVATALPFFIHIQWISGPLVNAILILVLFLSGLRSALVVSAVPSLMALAGGLLPAPLAPVIPFIIIGNMVFVIIIDRLYSRFKNEQKGYWTGVFAGAVAKFLLLYFSAIFVIDFFIKNQKFAALAVKMFSVPQFVTAVIGGAIAWAILKWLKRI